MIGIHRYCKNVALAAILTGGLVGFTPALLAHGHSQSTVRNAQEQLKDDGYYKGAVDGVDGPLTHTAIRNFQHDKNLKVNGKLDRQTRDELGIASNREANRNATESNRRDDANRSATEANRNAGEADRYQQNTAAAPSSAAVSSAQRRLRDKGFYKGDVSGSMNAETRSAIREYQKNSNLNVTGRLDQATLSSLGVSK